MIFGRRYVSGCTTTWNPTANSNVFGGSISSGVTTLAACETACLAMTGCTGVDLDSNPNPDVCYTISFNSSGLVRVGLASGVTHYDKISTCAGNYTHVLFYVFVKPVHTLLFIRYCKSNISNFYVMTICVIFFRQKQI